MNSPAIVMAVILLLLVPILTSGQQQTVETNDTAAKILSREVRWINPQSDDVFSALTMDLAASHLPGGILTMRKCGMVQPKFIPAESSTLQKELNRMVKIMPDYQWALDDGVLNFSPRFYTPSPLDITIREFKAHNSTIFEAYNQLFDSQDVKNGFAALGLHEPDVQLVFGSGDSVKDPRRVDLDLRNTTLQKALNAIVRADGSKTWILSVYSCNGENTYQRILTN
jgi:hypothetical protein